MFQLVFHCKINYETVKEMPVAVRKWWWLRTKRELEPKDPNPPSTGKPPWMRGNEGAKNRDGGKR